MTFSTPWLGSKRVAFVPLFRTNAGPPDEIPPDWENTILRRVLFEPRPEANGADRSLREWLRVVSWGRAGIDPLVLQMQTINKPFVEPDELEGTLGASLRAQGVQSAVLVILGGRGSAANDGFWSRVAMAETNGQWLMDIIHSLTRFRDLFHLEGDVDPIERSIDTFDEMSAASQTHPTTFTKNELGWLDERNFAHYQIGSGVSGFILNFVSFADPPHVTGFTHAVRIGDSVPYMIVESRKKTDQFEAGMPSTNDFWERGIASEGVIAYRVQTRDPTGPREGPPGQTKKPLFLLTQTALQPGQETMLDNGVKLRVTAATPKAFLIQLSS